MRREDDGDEEGMLQPGMHAAFQSVERLERSLAHKSTPI